MSLYPFLLYGSVQFLNMKSSVEYFSAFPDHMDLVFFSCTAFCKFTMVEDIQYKIFYAVNLEDF